MFKIGCDWEIKVLMVRNPSKVPYALSRVAVRLRLFSSNNTKNMKNCFDRLEDKVKKLDYFLRELKNRVKDKYVVQFLLDR